MRGLVVALMLSLQACGMVRSLTEDAPPPAPTLANLRPVAVPEAGAPLGQKSLEELAELYRAVLPLTSDPKIRLSVQHRLADIQMLSDEDKLANTDVNEGLFSGAITAYEQLLSENPHSPLEDQFLYQLSKAYELSGNHTKSLAVLEQLSAEHPDSWYYAEAEFRRAESNFVAGNYRAAEDGYSRVIDFGDNSVYYSKALYMQGWSRFKQAKYRTAVASFTANLDVLMPANGGVETLPRSDRELVDDSFRVLGVIFSYLGGAESISAAMDQLGERDYQYLLYQNLGDLYLKQQRYRDSAETYKAYVMQFPDSGESHQLQIKVITAYEDGGFPELVVQEKQFYVATFELRRTSWLRSNWATRNAIDEKLQVFIPELAQHFHAMAQQASKNPDGKKIALQNYKQAATYYQLYVESFPKSPQVAEMAYLLAESQYEAGDYSGAIESYEWVAYRFPHFDKATDSAYAAIATYRKLELENTPMPNDEQMDKRIDAELRFARAFPDDQRAAGVLGHAAKGLFDRGEYRAAVKSAAQLVQWAPAPGAEITTPAWLVLGHSYYELADFSGAEESYQGALALLKQSDKRYAATFERLAASVYKQGEQAAERGKYAKAAEEFSRVLVVAPDSEIRMNAQFDAAQYYTKAGDYAQANRLLTDFRGRYPGNALTISIPAVMVGNYEALGEWGRAAQELDAIYAGETHADKKRDALYLAAEYYDKAGNTDIAILRYRSYAHTYEQPFVIRMEAMNQLARLYSDAGAHQKQGFWLAEIIRSHDAAGNDQNKRSLFLAASASSVLADDAFNTFRKLELRIPLKKSLKRKKIAMGKAVDAYNKTNGYGVEQFSTLATYRLARIYQQLGTDLLSSQRPANLDELAMGQYDLLLEEQAYPFEEKAIAIYKTNTRRSWDGVYDTWVKKSFTALAELMPARYAKAETKVQISEDIY